MLGYLRHHPAPSSRQGTEHNADTPPAAHGSYRPAGAAGGRVRPGRKSGLITCRTEC
jgi:hypothetical protein